MGVQNTKFIYSNSKKNNILYSGRGIRFMSIIDEYVIVNYEEARDITPGKLED